MTETAGLWDERRALRRAVAELYGMLQEIDREEHPVSAYIADPEAQRVARAAVRQHEGSARRSAARRRARA